MQYKLHLSLRQRATLKIAILFWQREEVKNKATEFFRSYDTFMINEASEKWLKLTKTVIDEWNKDELPHILEAELIHLVRMIGQTIFNWYRYVKDEYRTTIDTINFIDKIKWTPYGTINEVQIFKSSWLENSNLDVTEVYNFACRNAIYDHVDELWDKIPVNTQNRFRKHIYDRNRSPDEYMLRFSINHNHFNAMKYFWEMFTEYEKEENVLKCARMVVVRWGIHEDENESTSGYKMYQCLEICVVLMNQMSNNDKKSFFNKKLKLGLNRLSQEKFDVKSRVLTMLLSTWPWQELFMPVLKDMIQYQDDDSQMDCRFLNVITFYMNEDHVLGYSLEYSKYRFLLREAWLIIPAPIKEKIPQANPQFSSIDNLINMWDLDSLNLIINDPKIADVRDQFIDFGLNSYKQLVVDDQFDKLDQLINELFKFDEEQKKSFTQNLNPWSKIFKDHKFDIADKFLDWQSNTQEEQRFLKNNINHMELCAEFIKNYNFTALDKFLDWKFENLEERIRCEDHFKSDIFVIERIYDIWMTPRRHDYNVWERSSKFLDWVFESNDEISCFKKEKLVNIEIDQSVIDALVMMSECCIIDAFLSWCLLDKEEIQRIKRAIFMRNQRLAEA